MARSPDEGRGRRGRRAEGRTLEERCRLESLVSSASLPPPPRVSVDPISGAVTLGVELDIDFGGLDGQVVSSQCKVAPRLEFGAQLFAAEAAWEAPTSLLSVWPLTADVSFCRYRFAATGFNSKSNLVWDLIKPASNCHFNKPLKLTLSVLPRGKTGLRQNLTAHSCMAPGYSRWLMACTICAMTAAGSGTPSTSTNAAATDWFHPVERTQCQYTVCCSTSY